MKWLAVFSMTAVFLGGCIQQPAIPIFHPPEIPFQPVSGSQPISFSRIISTTEPGTQIGGYYSGLSKKPQINYFQRGGAVPDAAIFGRELNDELREDGFDVVGGQANLFEEDAAPKARFQLGGKIETWTLNIFGPAVGNCVEATAEVEWQVYDSFARKVVLKETVTGASLVPGPGANTMAKAVRNSLRCFIATTRFPEVVAKTAATVVTSASSYTNSLDVTVFKSSAPLALPADMEKVMDGVVVIRAGRTMACGVIVSPEGYILTAAHVVSGVKEVAVVLKSTLQLTATVVRVDSVDDIALIKIPGTGHHALELNLDAPPAAGSDLFAIGAPAGEKLSYSVTKGVVSGLRDIAGSKFLQTDASISPGNSGGPFLDKSGKVIGICSWKVVRPGFEGLSFGVPMDGVAKDLGISWK